MRRNRTVAIRAFTISIVTALLVGRVPTLATAGAKRPLAETLRFGPGVTNHPVHVVPSSATRVPANWPLGVDGSITCLTCHRKLPRLNDGTELFLRSFDAALGDSSAFCLNCHQDTGGRPSRTMHWMVTRLAHPKATTRRATRTGGAVDYASRQCLGCHDGVNAPDALNTTGASAPDGLGDRGRNHPIGVRYVGGSRGRDGHLRPESLLPVTVRLPNGKVSCVSCHNLYAQAPNLLSVPIEGSALCFACHTFD